MAALAQPLTAQAIALSTLTKVGSSIREGKAGTSEAMAVNGTGYAQWFSTEINTFVRNACEMEGIHPLRRWTTSPPKQMGGPMTFPTSKASASLATGRRQRSKDLNDINYHLSRPEGGGGLKVQERRAKGPPPNLFPHRRRLENFFMGSPIR